MPSKPRSRSSHDAAATQHLGPCSGRSASSAGAEVPRIGLVLGLEGSPLARKSTDWYRMIDSCARPEALIADFNGIYGPSALNLGHASGTPAVARHRWINALIVCCRRQSESRCCANAESASSRTTCPRASSCNASNKTTPPRRFRATIQVRKVSRSNNARPLFQCSSITV